jgi:hypothetical protein
VEILLYAWSEDLDEWVKVQCDEDGNLLVDLSGVNLNDLADVDAETPGDGEFLSFDLASGTWKARALTDADIPDTIARDAEVFAVIAAHAAISDAHHTPYTDADADERIALHAAIASAHHARYTDAEADARIALHAAISDAHHTPYTDADADERIALHAAIASAHHTRYTDAEAVTAMGVKGDSNPLNHDKYTDAEAVTAMGAKADNNPLNHDKYEPDDPADVMDEVDDFINGTTTSGQVGKLGWSYSGNLDYGFPIPGHPGVFYLYTNAVANSKAALWFLGLVTSSILNPDDNNDLTFIFDPYGTGGRIIFVGAMRFFSSSPGNKDRVGFEYNTGLGDTNWMLVTGDGASSTRIDSGVAVAGGTFIKLRVVYDGSSYSFYINDVLKGTISTTKPDTNLQVGFYVETLAADSAEIDPDFFRWKITGLGR